MSPKSPSSPAKPSSGQWIFQAALIALAVVPFVVFPPVRCKTKAAPGAATARQVFDPQTFARRFWAEKLVPAAKSATSVADLYAAIQANPATAAAKYAHPVGLGGTSYYFVAGRGVVTAVSDESITLSLPDNPTATVVIETGLVFGNAVRDGSGLLDVNAFANSEEFNAVASALNTIVEIEIIPTARKAGVVGSPLRFSGIAELANTDSDPRPLSLVPVSVSMEAAP
ncbi:MAG: DUF2291 family protein [Nibricoccus sp.]